MKTDFTPKFVTYFLDLTISASDECTFDVVRAFPIHVKPFSPIPIYLRQARAHNHTWKNLPPSLSVDVPHAKCMKTSAIPCSFRLFSVSQSYESEPIHPQCHAPIHVPAQDNDFLFGFRFFVFAQGRNERKQHTFSYDTCVLRIYSSTVQQ